MMWFSIGFAGACVIGAYLFRNTGLLMVMLLALCAIPVCVGFQKKIPAFSGLALVLLGVSFGAIWFYGYDQWRIEPARTLDGNKQEFAFRVNTHSWDTERGSAADCSISINGMSYKVRLYMTGNHELSPGDVVQTTAKFRLTDEGGSGEPTFHRTNGILLLAYQSGEASIRQGTPEFWDIPGLLRHRSISAIEERIPGEAAGFAKAILLSDRSDLDYLRSTQFSITGISHIVAVSGLHVSILFALIYWLAGKHRYMTAILGIPCLVLFAAMAGFVPSVTRAAIMQMLVMLALMLDREYDPKTALSAAVLAMLMWNPLVIASAGFQMSVGAVSGILIFYAPIHDWLADRLLKGKKKSKVQKLGSKLIASVSMTLSATILTTPIVAYYFGTVSVIAVISNILIIPVAAMIFYGTALVCLLSSVFRMLPDILGWVVSLLIRYVFAVTELLSKIPFAAVYTRSVYIVLWLIFCYAVLLLLYFSRKKDVVFSGVLCATALVIALFASHAEVRLDDYRVTALNVGQGQCILVQCNGETYMVDCGGSYGKDAGDYAARTLLSQGIFHLDGLILTHYDEDHIGGTEYLVQRMDVCRIFLPDVEGMDGFMERIQKVTDQVEFCPVSQDVQLPVGQGLLTIFAPKQAESSNDSGMAVLFQRGKYDTLITGDLSVDMERQLIRHKVLPDCEVLVVGHHGSHSSTSQELLDATAPDVAMISAGWNNSYGHPHPEVLERLQKFGCQIYRTDLMGDIIYRG